MKFLALASALLLLVACQASNEESSTETKQASEATSSTEVNLYSGRKENLMRPLLDSFTAETGIKVNLVSGKADALLSRIVNEGELSPADVLLTTDAGRLYRAKQAGIFTTLDSEVLVEAIPSQYRDIDKQWIGLSLRARPILALKDSKLNTPTRYEDLADPELGQSICIRSSGNIYNQSLAASLIAANGVEATFEWAQGVVANMARQPEGGDRDQIRALAAGQCPLAVANTYYLANMLADAENENDFSAASKVQVIWPNQDGRGAHVNVSGAGILKTAPNADAALKLLEFLASDQAQQIYADVNFEYPVRDNIALNPIVADFGKFKVDTLNLSTLGTNNTEAVKIFDQAAWK